MSANEAADERPSKRLKTSPSPERDQIQSLDSSLAESPVSQTDFVTEKEQKVGISILVSGPKPILRGLVKKRYADFLVNEILPGGRVLHLTKTTADNERADAADATNGQNEEISTTAVIPAAEPKVATESSVSTSTEKVVNGTQTNIDQTEIEKPAGGIPKISAEDKATLISYLNEQAVTDILALHSSIHLNQRGNQRPPHRANKIHDRPHPSAPTSIRPSAASSPLRSTLARPTKVSSC